MAIVLGYHGCNQETARRVLDGALFEPSNKEYDWLGSGSYFWEWDMLRAYEWARDRWQDAPCVVGAVIDLGNCLDLTTRTGADAVKGAYRSYVKLQQETGNPLPTNKSAKNTEANDRVLRYLDRAVIDHLHAGIKDIATANEGLIREFDTVRALFPEGAELYKDAGFREKTHVQIAVRGASVVRGVFRVPLYELDDLGIGNIYSSKV